MRGVCCEPAVAQFEIAPSQALFSALLIPTCTLFAAFGVGIWQAAEGRRRLRISGGLLITFGVIALIAGPFVAMRPRGAEQGLAGALHLIEGGLASRSASIGTHINCGSSDWL